MKSESNLVYQVWECVRDSIPAAKRTDTAVAILKYFEEYGFESSDLIDIVDEDVYLTTAHQIVFDTFIDEDEEETDFDYEELE